MSNFTRSPKFAPSTTRCAVYCRVSSAGQEENHSLPTQEAACRQYAEERGWIVAHLHHEVHTGADLYGRPCLSTLRDQIRSGEVDVLLAYALDRLSRKQTHVAILAEECERAGVRLAFVTEDFEDGAVGTFIRSAKAFAAELEREKIKERTRRGIRARAESGLPLPGPRPLYGYRWRDEKKTGLEFDAEHAPVVQGIYRDVLAGKSLRAVTRALNDRGVPTPAGGQAWSLGTVHKILTNPAYVGTMWAFRWKAEKMPGGWIAMEERPEADRIAMPAGVVPPMVTAEEFAAVRARLAANRAQSSRNNHDPEATLLRGGFARCGYCGGTLQVERDRRAEGGNGPTYTCGTTNSDRFGCPPFAIAAPLLDGAVWQRVLGVLRDPSLIAREAARRRQDGRFAADLDIVGRRIADVEKRQATLTRLMSEIEDADAAAPLVAELRNLASQKKELTAERETLETGQAAQRADEDRLINLTEWCCRVSANLESLSYLERRDVLAALGVSARVWRKDHTPRWEITMDVRELDLASDGRPIVSPTVGACGSP